MTIALHMDTLEIEVRKDRPSMGKQNPAAKNSKCEIQKPYKAEPVDYRLLEEMSMHMIDRLENPMERY